jgi:hypothetical protein
MRMRTLQCRIRPRVLRPIDVAPFEKGLVACYPFIGNADDESGHGYNKSVNGAALKVSNKRLLYTTISCTFKDTIGGVQWENF